MECNIWCEPKNLYNGGVGSSPDGSGMTKSWDQMRKAKEDSYFEKRDREALDRISAAKKVEKPLLSPVTGEPMEPIAIDGVVINRCKTSGGIWLDPADLEKLAETHRHQSDGVVAAWVRNTIKAIKI